MLAAAIRLIDLGFFRSGGAEYADENGTFGRRPFSASWARDSDFGNLATRGRAESAVVKLLASAA